MRTQSYQGDRMVERGLDTYPILAITCVQITSFLALG